MGVKYDPFDAETRGNPHPIYAQLRREAPVYHCAERDFYVVSRYQDITRVLRDPALWSSRFGPGLGFAPENSGALVGVDPPEHTFQRGLIGTVFGSRAIVQLEPVIQAFTQSLLDDLVPRGSGDLIPAFAERIPLVVICRLLGFDEARLASFRRYVHVATLAVMEEADPEELGQLTQGVTAYFQDEIDRRKAALADGTGPPDDLVTRLLDTEADGRRLEDPVLLGFMSFLLIGGSGTTTMLIGNLVHQLLRHPDRLERLRADRDLIDVAIEESLRFDAPVHGLFRTPTRDVELCGVTIPRDKKTLVLYASGNRDEEVWDDPDQFRLDRDRRSLSRHLAFGYGTHFCLGAQLARMETRIALNGLLDRMPKLRPNGEAVETEPTVLKGYDHLPVAWD